MRTSQWVWVWVLASAAPAAGQQVKADSMRSARNAVLAPKSRLPRRIIAPLPVQQQQGPINPRLLPDISAVGDLIGDLSPDSSTQEDGERFLVREVELAFQAAVDPYFRGDIFLGVSPSEGIDVEQAFITTTALPAAIEVRLGKYLMPVGKINTTHRHDLHTIEYPWIIQRFFGPEGLKGTGFYVSRIFGVFGFYQELIGTAIDVFGEPLEDVGEVLENPNNDLSDIGFSARLRNYWDLSESSNLELSGSAITGKRTQPAFLLLEPIGVNARQTVFGADLTYRWRPLEQGLYKSFILQAEFMRQLNESDPELPDPDVIFEGPTGDFSGAYVFARYQIKRRGYLGARFDWLEDPDTDGETFIAGSGYFEFFPSEFSKLMIAYERLMPETGDATNRFLLQATFALGPHKPHPF
jgi:hypothetical protein